jgi:alginate O-acetyltransferase complex protein AlgI
MTLALIIVSFIVAATLGLVIRNHWRIHLLLGCSVLAVFAFQPLLPVRGLDFWLPSATLALASFTWILTASPENRSWKNSGPAAIILGGMVLLLGLSRYLGVSINLTASRPPQTIQILFGGTIVVLVAFLLARFTKPNKTVLMFTFVFILILFVILKVPFFATKVSEILRIMNHQSGSLALGQDLRWLGFSYIAFRLLHTIRDRISGRLPAVSLSEYMVYIIFFPALTAGPIDRIERFVGDLRRPLALTGEDIGEAGKRLTIGLFKKFVIADLLAMIALNATNALQVRTAGWAWVLLYAFAFQIFFDFSGYTDIAIGLGGLLGVKLPENFNTPYLKPNLTKFWNNWHMTLTQWFRAYFFNPLTRSLRSGRKPLPIPIVIFITQLSTMILIGLWHGVTLNYIAWGVWHGLGLFVHNRWSDFAKASFNHPSFYWQKVLDIGGVFLTFNFVSLGWVFFALPDISISTHFISVLFGLA